MQEDSTEDYNDKLLNEDNNNLDNQINNTDMDELTLALLMNKNHYRKYVAQTNPEQAILDNQMIDDIRKYRNRILKITSVMIDSPDIQISTDINQIFNTYTKHLIRHFKMKDDEQPHNEKYNNEDDTLFGNMNDDNDTSSYSQKSTSSLWGKDRVVKKGNLPIANYDMRMFSKR
jgi:hypothetical protein